MAYDESLRLTPVLIVAPDFPREGLERKLSGHVEVEAILAPDGRMKSWTAHPDSEASRPFVIEVEQVIGHWRFNRQVGPDCLPADTPIRTRVWFEWNGDEPKVSVERASLPRRDGAPAGAAAKPKKRPHPLYPETMLRRGLQADVYARIEIDAAGKVEAVEAVAYPRQERTNLAPFEAAVRATLEDWEFPERAAKWRYCLTVHFRIRD